MLSYLFGNKMNTTPATTPNTTAAPSPFVAALSATNVPQRVINEKGAVAFSTTGKAVADFFVQSVRGLTGPRLAELLTAAWSDDALLTLKAIFQLRDMRGKGKGERKLFRECLQWLAVHYPNTLMLNLQHVAEYGRWDDLFSLWALTNTDTGKTIWLMVLKIVTDQVKLDWDILNKNFAKPEACRISLLAKWLPIEGSKTWPKEMTMSIAKAVHKSIGRTLKVKVTRTTVDTPAVVDAEGIVVLAATTTRGMTLMYKPGEPKTIKAPLVNYRNIGAALRAVLDLPEVLMASKRTTELDFNAIAGQAMRRYGKTCPTKCGDEKCKKCKALIRREHDRFAAFLTELAKPADQKDPTITAKVNARTMLPHQITETYMSHSSNADPMLDAMWEGICARVPAEIAGKFFCMVDVSGSMEGIPMQVAIALGLLYSTHGKGPFRNSMVTFHESPTFVTLKTTTLYERVQEVKHLPWGGATHIHKAFLLILDAARQANLKQEDLPEYFCILSDMQFDAADRSWATNLETARREFARAGYIMPRLILWNLRSTGSFPTSNAVNDYATYMSGFSPDMLDCMLKGEAFNPFTAMTNTLNDPRYDRLLLA